MFYSTTCGLFAFVYKKNVVRVFCAKQRVFIQPKGKTTERRPQSSKGRGESSPRRYKQNTMPSGETSGYKACEWRRLWVMWEMLGWALSEHPTCGWR